MEILNYSDTSIALKKKLKNFYGNLRAPIEKEVAEIPSKSRIIGNLWPGMESLKQRLKMPDLWKCFSTASYGRH